MEQAGLPFRGKTVQSRHASWTGTRQALKTYGEKVSAYLQLLTNAGALTDHEAAALMHCGLSSICSIRNSLIEQGTPIAPDGFNEQAWADGGRTKRTRWKLAQ